MAPTGDTAPITVAAAGTHDLSVTIGWQRHGHRDERSGRDRLRHDLLGDVR